MKLAVLSVSLGSKFAIFQLWNAFWALHLELHEKRWIKRSFHSPWSLQKVKFFDHNLVILDKMALFWNKGYAIFYIKPILSLFPSFLGYEWLDSLNRSVTFGFQNGVCRFSTINSSRDTKRGYLGGGLNFLYEMRICITFVWIMRSTSFFHRSKKTQKQHFFESITDIWRHMNKWRQI